MEGDGRETSTGLESRRPDVNKCRDDRTGSESKRLHWKATVFERRFSIDRRCDLVLAAMKSIRTLHCAIKIAEEMRGK